MLDDDILFCYFIDSTLRQKINSIEVNCEAARPEPEDSPTGIICATCYNRDKEDLLLI
jgi:hypothetical protein